uniref:Glycoside hydrolase family 1 protein n=1 Tax=Mycena chlorophos TaxID=658473 RepID=A0ABQ0L2Q9_MYCCL|nr:glycoside hydrolase family 1 protein [Mycena chlorophos]
MKVLRRMASSNYGYCECLSASALTINSSQVGPVQAPPFTTTYVPTSTSVPLPSPPPPLYPSFYAPAPKDVLPDLKFPSGFKFGVDTAAYQVEGAVKNARRSGTGIVANPAVSSIIRLVADIVDLQYYLYKESRRAGCQCPFVLVCPASLEFAVDTDFPSGFPGRASYPWAPRTPRSIKQGWTITVTVSSVDATLAPGVNASMAPYICSYYLLKAHVGAVKAFREMNITGEIAFKSDDFIERHTAFRIGDFAAPLYTTGDWPTDTLPPKYLPRNVRDGGFRELGAPDSAAKSSIPPNHVPPPLAEGATGPAEELLEYAGRRQPPERAFVLSLTRLL